MPRRLPVPPSGPWRAPGCGVCIPAALLLSMAACAPPDADPPGADAVAVAPEAGVEEAVWSPDGRRLAVTWTQGGRARLVGLFGPADGQPPAEGTGLPLADGEAGWASWAPDGLWIAFAAGEAGARDVHRARPDGTGAENLTASGSDDYDPAYSPDGRTLAFVSDRDGGVAKLFLMRAGGGEPRLAAELPGPVRRPVWAPDGRRLAVEVAEELEPAIYFVAPEGANWGRFMPGAQPSWSPDGERVLFVERDTLFWRPAEGGSRRFLAAGASAPRVSPDGAWLAFVRREGASRALFLMDLKTSTVTRITPP